MRDINTMSRNDRGVSESIGFLLIFAIVVTGIGLVTLYGYPMLMQQQTSADEQIMEKNMIVLQNDMKSLAYKTVPYKETSLKVGGGTLGVHNQSTSPAIGTISIYDCVLLAPDPDSYVYQFHPGDLRYESANARTDLSLQNGAVVKRDRAGQGSVMLAEPRWFYDNTANTMVINLIAINSSSYLARAGVGTVQMSLAESNYTYQYPIGKEICLDYTSNADIDFSTAWNNYFTRTLKDPSQSGNIYTYHLPLDPARQATLAIKKYTIFIKSV